MCVILFSAGNRVDDFMKNLEKHKPKPNIMSAIADVNGPLLGELGLW